MGEKRVESAEEMNNASTRGGGGGWRKRVVVMSVVTVGGEDKHKVLLKSRDVAVTLLCFCGTLFQVLYSYNV